MMRKRNLEGENHSEKQGPTVVYSTSKLTGCHDFNEGSWSSWWRISLFSAKSVLPFHPLNPINIQLIVSISMLTV